MGLSHFERLPVELKVEIFGLCLDSHPDFSVKEAPLLLSRICSSWRTLAHSTPRLWACFQVNVPDLSTDSTWTRNHIATMKLWLARSKSYPLTVRITQNPVGRTPDSRSALFLAALIPHAHRWKSIDMCIPSSNFKPLQDSPPSQFMALGAMTIGMRGKWSADIPLDVRALGIPWNQLVELNLYLDHRHLLTLDECWTILAQCHILSKCTLNADCTFDLPGRQPTIYPLPALKHLYLILQSGELAFHNAVQVTDSAPSSLILFLEQLHLTQLQTLTLEWLVKWDGDDNEGRWSEIQPRFISVLSSLGPSLRALNLAYLPLNESELLNCFAQVPNITHLDLRFSLADKEHDPVSDDFLCALRSGQSSLSLLRLLETVFLQCSGARCTPQSIIDFVHSRWTESTTEDPAMHLTSLRFISMKLNSFDFNDVLSGWAEAGLDVSIGQVVVR